MQRPPEGTLTCRCGHSVAIHTEGRYLGEGIFTTQACEVCKCIRPLPDLATYPVSQLWVTS